ncbi:hypothetical protein P168DRAFT_300817 [Aspergillus campestris IBT 28561]|uniref:Aminoglycoside phosphotransferase domain-containing protein n=1 Tax=Aspergillus campestris (strain IBT 28561) TaxID=1392248 RepID=A0A2I1DDT9_ASPC2|nr:uncharacterized protein P168DRAFT_300817 [Aspergillus campestris IBT 28561]PKY08052.1 hypothetical protein P168DRAFT_300817 [Aspergillus campestris IBT 28561]
MGWDIATVSEETLIDLCHKAEKEIGITRGLTEGDQFIQLSEHIAVKYGYSVTAAEAATQELAYNKADPTIVHIPQVYRFIEAKGSSARTKGYLFMEYMPGQNLANVDIEAHKDIIPRIAKIVAHLGEIQAGRQSAPGPVGGGEPYGYLWGDDGAKTVFNSVSDLNTYMNKRLKLRNDSIDLTPHPLVLCHLDLCRRNFILKDDGVFLCLANWGSAGFYPRFFESAMVSCMLPYDGLYEQPLLQEIEKVQRGNLV